nr:apelin isoform X1 [Anas platyrhynchos]
MRPTGCPPPCARSARCLPRGSCIPGAAPGGTWPGRQRGGPGGPGGGSTSAGGGGGAGRAAEPPRGGRAAGPGRALAAYKCGDPGAGPPPPPPPPPPPLPPPSQRLPPVPGGAWRSGAGCCCCCCCCCSASPWPPPPRGPLPDGTGPQRGRIRVLVRPRGARRGAGQRAGGWRRLRRPRPRLSHKGPMPF